MDNLWSEKEAKKCKSNLDLRVYTSNLLGANDELVLHGGGNTSVKGDIDGIDVLHVSGRDSNLAEIKAEGFSPLRLDMLLDMAKQESLSDIEMLQGEQEAMMMASAPNPSVEAILHAIIPYKFVEHTHADAIVTISNAVSGKENIAKLYPNYLIVDYVMPGFALAQRVYELTKEKKWDDIEGIILHNHGIFTFANDAKESYTKMIDAVTKAERFLDENATVEIMHKYVHSDCDIGRVVKTLGEYKGHDIHIAINQTPLAAFYASQENLREFASRGVLVPEHIIQTKRVPLIMEDTDLIGGLDRYVEAYKEYFNKYATDEVMLNPAPNYMIIKNLAVVCFGRSREEAKVIYDIVEHTMLAVLRADKLGGYKSISEKDSFQMEYWELKHN